MSVRGAEWCRVVLSGAATDPDPAEPHAHVLYATHGAQNKVHDQTTHQDVVQGECLKHTTSFTHFILVEHIRM